MARKLGIELLKSESIEFGSSVLEVSKIKINGREMLSFAKFYKDASGEKKFPKSLAVPLGLSAQVI